MFTASLHRTERSTGRTVDGFVFFVNIDNMDQYIEGEGRADIRRRGRAAPGYQAGDALRLCEPGLAAVGTGAGQSGTPLPFGRRRAAEAPAPLGSPHRRAAKTVRRSGAGARHQPQPD